MSRPAAARAEAVAMCERHGVRLETTPFIVGGMRGYFPKSMGPTSGNDRDLYDDGFFILTATFFKTYNGNADPSGRKDGRASLVPGVYPVYKFDTHHGSKRQYPAICQRFGPVNVLRDGHPPRPDRGMFGINIHEGGNWGTSSLGCQTLPNDQWEEFYADAKREAIKVYGDRYDKVPITYVLFDMTVERAAAPPPPAAPPAPPAGDVGFGGALGAFAGAALGGLAALAEQEPAPHPRISSEILKAAIASQAKWGIPASISLAQWALESGWGKHMPPGSNNPFGIKARPGEPTVVANTREVIDGQDRHEDAGFRAFASIAEAFDRHGELLANRAPYAAARAKLPDPDAFADALTGVYATDPNYGKVLKQIMRGSELYQYNAGAG